jgi:hypothetical protein
VGADCVGAPAPLDLVDWPFPTGKKGPSGENPLIPNSKVRPAQIVFMGEEMLLVGLGRLTWRSWRAGWTCV